jgi:two-component system, chemotaxis family, protein-glutamate methylesterase/glutaminase
MKILIVDDSIVYRSAIKRVLESLSIKATIQVASNGKIACDFLKSAQFDVVVMDIEMPVMTGFEAISEIRKTDQITPIIVFAQDGNRGAQDAMKALDLGANEFVCKSVNVGNQEDNLEHIKMELLPKLLSLVSNKLKKQKQVELPRSNFPDFGRLDFSSVNLICIGSSTGGPDALRKVFLKLKDPPSVPVVMVQHMPPVFTQQFAGMLSKISGLDVREAKDGDRLQKGVFYIAPGDYHMLVKKNDTGLYLHLNQEEKVCYVRPAFDVLLKSVANLGHLKPLVITLTGMGDDGTEGVCAIREKLLGSIIAIQDKESSVVWGMPGAIFAKSYHHLMVNIEEVNHLIRKVG